MNSRKFVLLFSGILFISGCGNAAPPPINTAMPQSPSGLSFDNQTENSQIQTKTQTLPSSAERTVTQTPSIPENKPMEFDAKKHYTALLHTSAGDIQIALNFGETPNTVKNFVDLSRNKYYENVIFHRIVQGFMIQGGDPTGTGRGGPGYKFNDEKFSGEYTRGTVAMANSGPNTNGSQFFIMQADQALPKLYTIFGHVTKGMDVVDKIANAEATMNAQGTEQSVPVKPEKILSVEITEK